MRVWVGFYYIHSILLHGAYRFIFCVILYIHYLVWSKGNAEQQYNLVYFNLTIEKQQQLANIDGSTLKYKCIGPFVIDGNLENSCGNRNYCQGSWSEKCGE